MKRLNLEVVVGVFVVLGLLSLAYLSVYLGRLQLLGGNTYGLTATFPTVAGLRIGAAIEIAGVQVGRVQDISLQDYDARVTMRLQKTVRLQEDAIASIRTRGLIGEKYVRITPGGSDRLLTDGGSIRDIEAPIDMEDLIGRFVQGKL